MRKIALLAALLVPLSASLALPTPAMAETPQYPLPEVVMSDFQARAKIKAPLTRVGSTTYRKLGFTIYHATLWAPGGVYAEDKPFVLQIRYARDLDQETLVDAVASDVEANERPDPMTMAAWNETLNQIIPAVKKQEELIGVTIPGEVSKLYFNGQHHAEMTDQRLSRAFMGIWLGPNADPKVRARLTGQPVTD